MTLLDKKSIKVWSKWLYYISFRPNPYFGCVIGRVGNRISGGKFNLDGVEYQLAKNDGENSIHGGVKVRYNINP